MTFKKNINGKLLRCGYTTGTCAAAAASAATRLLLSGQNPDTVTLTTPSGAALMLDVLNTSLTAEAARCAIKKDSGDDPDITNGVLVFAAVRRSCKGISIEGGEGIGRITKPGLDQAVGASAINSVPRQMITEAVCEVCRECGYDGGISVVISIPGGETIAKRTFNPRMGIEGGLSVIGTTGIVDPMSNKALVDTIRLELRQLAAAGAKAVLFTPGNYGTHFARERLHLSMSGHISCSNFIGDAIDAAVETGFSSILLIGHIGKLVKLGIGATNTHSSFGDGRMETLIACALRAGASLGILRDIADCVSTDAALALLYDAGLLKETMAILGDRISACLLRRVPENVKIGFICFTNAEPFSGVLLESETAYELIELWR